MTTVLVRPTNGVSYGVAYTVTSTDVTNAGVLFDFRKEGVGTYRYDLVAFLRVSTAGGAVVNPAGYTVTYPVPGQVLIGNTSVLVAGDILNLVFQRAGQVNMPATE
jgi:hypothetical protein